MLRRLLLRWALAFSGACLAAYAAMHAMQWWFVTRLLGAQPTSVDTIMQEPNEWLDRLIEVEGYVDWTSAEDEWIGCSYRLVEGWKSVRVEASRCEGLERRHGLFVQVAGKLRRHGSSFVLEQQRAAWNAEGISAVRYFPPEIPKGVTESTVRARADAFRRVVAGLSSGAREPQAVRRLLKHAMHGCLLRFDGSAACWHNHQWQGELQGKPSELFAVIDAPPLVHLELGAYAGGGVSAAGEVYWFSAPRTDLEDGEEPKGPRGKARRVDMPKATSLWFTDSTYCAALENGNVACWNGRKPPHERPALVTGLERFASWCEVGRDEIRCPDAPPLSRTGVQDFVHSEGGAGYSHYCVLRGGQVSCRGSNWFGELGVARSSASKSEFEEWTPIVTTDPVVEVAAGARHTCVQLTSGWVECWGANERGQSSPFEPVMSSTRALRVARFPLDWELSAHEDLTCMSNAGAISCWGYCETLPAIPGLVCTTWPVAAAQ
jgi:hypothetical protein